MRLPQNAPPKKTFQIPRYLTVLIVTIVAILFAVVLWFVYPKSHLHQDEAQVREAPDEISGLYLSHEVKKRPKDLRLRLRLIHHELLLGKLDRAQKLITPHLVKHPKSNVAWQFAWYDYRTRFLRLTAKKKKTVFKSEKKSKRAVSKKALKQSMQQLKSAPISDEQLLMLSKNAIELKWYDVAKSVGRRLLTQKAQLNVGQLATMGKGGYLSGDFLLSAQFYLAAFHKADKKDKQKQFYMDAINSLLAGQLLPKQWSLVLKDSQAFKDDPQVLTMLAKAALASKKPKLASQWMRQAIGLKYTSVTGSDS